MTNTDTKPFEWTDELVKEFLNEGERYKYNWEKEINDFKQSKSIPNKQDERIEVIFVAETQKFSDGTCDYIFQSSKEVITDKFPAIKQAIEAAINRKEGEPLFDKAAYERLFDQNQELMSKIEFLQASEDANRDKVFTQSEVDTIREETWEAAREFYGYDAGRFDNVIYKTLQDYLNSLSKPSIKPPLGLLPQWIWEENRLDDINAAIERYKEAGKEIPQEWINEQYDLSKKIKPSTTPIEDKGWEIGDEAKLWAALDILSRIWYYGGFKIETANERTLAGIMNDLGLFPTTEEKILMRPGYDEYNKKYLSFSIDSIPSNPQDKGNVLFTTDDGVQLFNENDYYWRVYDDLSIGKFQVKDPTTYKLLKSVSTEELAVSTEELAKAYVLVKQKLNQ